MVELSPEAREVIREIISAESRVSVRTLSGIKLVRGMAELIAAGDAHDAWSPEHRSLLIAVTACISLDIHLAIEEGRLTRRIEQAN